MAAPDTSAAWGDNPERELREEVEKSPSRHTHTPDRWRIPLNSARSDTVPRRKGAVRLFIHLFMCTYITQPVDAGFAVGLGSEAYAPPLD